MASAQLILDLLPELEPAGHWLVANHEHDRVEHGLAELDVQTTSWRRHALPGPAARLPADGPYDGAVLRLPKDKLALELDLHLIGARMAEGASLLVHGMNDEGVKSAGKRMAVLFDEITTLDTRRHGRVWHGVRSQARARGTLEDWARTVHLDLPGGHGVDLNAFPGCFAKGGLDTGTAALLQALGGLDLSGVDNAYDFACGIGVIGAWLRHARPEIQLTGSDADALCIEACRRSGLYPHLACGDGPTVVERPAAGWDLIVSNPPLHRGKADDVSALDALIDSLPRSLRPGGRAVLVVQRHRPVLPRLERALPGATVLSEAAGYRIYLGTKR